MKKYAKNFLGNPKLYPPPITTQSKPINKGMSKSSPKNF